MIKFENFTIRSLDMDDLNRYYNLVERNRKRLEDFFAEKVSKTQDLKSTESFLYEIDTKRKNRE